MALIKCTECGKEISDSAVSCPHCGCKTAQARKNEEAKIFRNTTLTVNIICIALDIIGAFLFIPGISKLHDYGYNLFLDNWADSYRSTVVEAGRRSVTGLVLIIIGFVGAILFKKFFVDRVNANSKFSPRDERMEHFYKNIPSAPKSTRKCCPHCGKVVTSDICEICGKSIDSAPDKTPTRQRIQQEDDGCWICPSCGRKNLSTRTDCWNCNYHG